MSRVWRMSIAAIVPYFAFIGVLSVAPASLGWVPFGGSISIAIYLGLFLFAWPIIVSVAYKLAADRDEGKP
jgi:uncharacterized membrane protein (DUF485 family)